jgi:pimeloyl-[acyl-carrier protein] methyl ester esterase
MKSSAARRLFQALDRMTILVLLPGMDGTGALFQPLIDALGPAQIVTVLKYPGAELLGYAELASIVRKALPTEPFVLLAESFSGPIAISLASESPQGLMGVILCCSFASSPRPLAAVAAPGLQLPLPLPPMFVIAPALMGRFSNAALRGLLRTALAKVSPQVLRYRLAAALSCNVIDRLSHIKVPLLYMQATDDWLIPASAAKAIASVLPRTAVTQVRGPHFLLQVNPKESAEVIRSFMGGLRQFGA